MFCSNFVPKTHRFWDIRLVSIQWPWNPGWGSLEVIENYTMQSGAHDFLLTFHSNHRPISHRFRDKRRYPSKIARKSPIFPPHVFNAPAEGVGESPWNCVSAQGSQETIMMGLSDGGKKFSDRFSRFDTIPEWDRQPPSQTHCRSYCRAYYVAQVKISWLFTELFKNRGRF